MVAILVVTIGSLVAVFRTSRLLAEQIEHRLETEGRMQEAQSTAEKRSRDAMDCTAALMSEKTARKDAEQKIRAGQQIIQNAEDELRKSENAVRSSRRAHESWLPTTWRRNRNC